jgi:transposase-like protein
MRQGKNVKNAACCIFRARDFTETLNVNVKNASPSKRQGAVLNSDKLILSEAKMKKYSEEEKAMWLEDWKASGKSITAYAKANGLNPQTLTNWIRKGGEGQRFIEIKPYELEPIRYLPEILIEKGEIKIHIPVSINQNGLRAVIEGLGCQL